MKLTFCLFFATIIVIILLFILVLLKIKYQIYYDNDEEMGNKIERFKPRYKKRQYKRSYGLFSHIFGSRYYNQQDIDDKHNIDYKLEKYLKERLKDIKKELIKTDNYIDTLSKMDRSSGEVTIRIESANDKYNKLKMEKNKIKKLLKH
jgi:hypothetical protein